MVWKNKCVGSIPFNFSNPSLWPYQITHESHCPFTSSFSLPSPFSCFLFDWKFSYSFFLFFLLPRVRIDILTLGQGLSEATWKKNSNLIYYEKKQERFAIVIVIVCWLCCGFLRFRKWEKKKGVRYQVCNFVFLLAICCWFKLPKIILLHY